MIFCMRRQEWYQISFKKIYLYDQKRVRRDQHGY